MNKLICKSKLNIFQDILVGLGLFITIYTTNNLLYNISIIYIYLIYSINAFILLFNIICKNNRYTFIKALTIRWYENKKVYYRDTNIYYLIKGLVYSILLTYHQEYSLILIILITLILDYYNNIKYFK